MRHLWICTFCEQVGDDRRQGGKEWSQEHADRTHVDGQVEVVLWKRFKKMLSDL